MVYIHFPAKLTEEEEMLQRKYAKLKKKKRALQALRAPKPEPAPIEEKKKRKATEEAADATEKAKKLLKSGAIKVAAEKKDQTFKRTKRQKETDKSAVGFTPFTSTQEYEDERTDEGTPRKMKGLYDSFVSSREGSEPSEQLSESRFRERDDYRDRDFKRRGRDRDPPKRGHTVYVFGHGVSEDIVKRSFANIGKIVNITVETEKSVAFVTYDKMEDADEAIAQLNGSMVSGVQLKVSMARRQPSFESSTDQSNSSWSSIAASQSQKGTSSHKDKRDLVTYEENDDIF